jgi:predicted acetyltransferase
MSTAHAPYPVAVLQADERAAFARALARSFGDTLDDDAVAHLIAAELTDPTRSLVARDGDRIVGTTTVLDFTMTVPGAPAVTCAGVTSVSVQPTHRRRGVMRSLMRRQLDDLHAAGTSWASLYASEAAIYGRFGYGVASRSLQLRLDGPWSDFARPVEHPGAVEMLEPTEAAPRLAAVYARQRTQVPGMLSMPEDRWRLHLDWDPANERDGGSERQIAAVDNRGAVVYRVKRGWTDAGPDSTVRVEFCFATDPEVCRQLWSYVLNIDLVQHVNAMMRPVDEPLLWLLAERHRLQVTEGMPCYVRLIDIGAALSQRGTAVDGAVVLAVSDTFCPWNARRWRLEGDGSALRCAPTDEPADVALDVRELASLSLGGVTPFELAGAGLVAEETPGALGRLARLLASERSPWNPFIF